LFLREIIYIKALWLKDFSHCDNVHEARENFSLTPSDPKKKALADFAKAFKAVGEGFEPSRGS
jgi:hypothetical protein